MTFVGFSRGMATPKTQTKKESKKYIPVKTSFVSPFTAKWSSLPQEDMNFILKTLTDKLLSTGLHKIEVKICRPLKKRKEKEGKPAATSEPEPQVSQDAEAQEVPKNGWTDVTARKQLAIGINEVTKALERNQLRLLLVCKSVKPAHMTDHLMVLSASRGVPACQVPRLSQSVSEPLGLKSVLALGFRRCGSEDQEAFADTVDVITPRVPPVDVAWMLGTGLTSKRKKIGKEEEEEQEGGSEKRGQKRKLESEEEEEQASPCTLQPLKVKKIVANPARKKKKMKGK